MAFVKATKKAAKLRLGLYGPSGSGKTFTALALATNLGKRVAVIDTERGSASLYADKFEFDVMELEDFHPSRFIAAIREAEQAGYDVIIIDSISHAWVGEGGVLDVVDSAAVRAHGNSHAAWKEGTPIYRKLVDAVLQSGAHVIATMRSKTEWAMEKNERGKTTPRKIGTAPVMRDGIEYEFTITGWMDTDHNLVIDKSRFDAIAGGMFAKPGADLAKRIGAWLADGVPAPDDAVVDALKKAIEAASNMDDFAAAMARVTSTAGLTLKQKDALRATATATKARIASAAAPAPVTAKANDKPAGKVAVSFAVRSLLEKLAGATTRDALKDASTAITAALKAGEVSESERVEILIPAYKVRMGEVRS